jgi:hypothetical protein
LCAEDEAKKLQKKLKKRERRVEELRKDLEKAKAVPSLFLSLFLICHLVFVSISLHAAGGERSGREEQAAAGGRRGAEEAAEGAVRHFQQLRFPHLGSSFYFCSLIYSDLSISPERRPGRPKWRPCAQRSAT